MKNRGLFFGFLIVLVLASMGCALTSRLFPTPTPQPTYTPLPTYTPVPTSTKVPTATATEMPTATAVPTQVPPTATATARPYIAPTAAPATQVPQQSSGGNTPVTWANETSHVIKIVASGGTTYTITLQAHETRQVYWNAGTYQVKYYLDGSSSVAGSESITIKAEQHYLYTLNFR